MKRVEKRVARSFSLSVGGGGREEEEEESTIPWRMTNICSLEIVSSPLPSRPRPPPRPPPSRERYVCN